MPVQPLPDAVKKTILERLRNEEEHVKQFHRLLRDVLYDTVNKKHGRVDERLVLIQDLEKKFPYLDGERKVTIQAYIAPYGPKTEAQEYENSYSPRSMLPKCQPPLKRRRIA